jgi:2,3-bisphosphoglycerate-dependent phosphoglycerate mutase
MNNPKSKIQNPKSLWLIRHGESTANVARYRAESEKLLTIEYAEREMDIPLSETGVQQAVAAGHWFKFQPVKPTVIFTSPYLRTIETARLIAENAKFKDLEIFEDERLRERELGIFDRLTKLGAMQKYPEECEKRESLGKFYYRPLGGENWADVALRLRNFWRDLCLNFADEKVLIVTHEVVIRVFRYVFERLTETDILTIDRSCDIGNGAVSAYQFDEEQNKLVLKLDNHRP